MSQTDESNVNNNPNQETPASTNLAISIVERMTRGRELVSPWVQRSLLQQSAGVSSSSSQFQPRPAGLTTANTSALLNRLQRSADEGAIWRPDVGSLNPNMVGGFTHRIVSRFTETDTETGTQETWPVEETDFALAGAWGESEATEAVEDSSPALSYTVDDIRQALQNRDWSAPAPVTPTPPSGESASSTPPVQRKSAAGGKKEEAALPFTLEEVRAALETPHFTRSDTPPTQAAPPPVQRQPDRPAVSPPTGKPTHIPKRRLRSRVEEIDPSAAKSPSSPLPMPPLSPESGRSDSAPVQRQVDRPPPPSRPPTPKKIAADAPTASPSSEGQSPSLPVQRQTTPESAPPTPTVSKTTDDLMDQEPATARPSPAAIQRQSETPGVDEDVDVAVDAVDEPSVLPTAATQAEVDEPSATVQRQSDLPLSPRPPAQPGLSREPAEATESPASSTEPESEPSAAAEETAPSASPRADLPAAPVQRQVESTTTPTSPASLADDELSSTEGSTIEEGGDEALESDAEHQTTSAPTGQRQPEADLPLKSSLPSAQAQAVQKQSESPESTSTATDEITASTIEPSAEPSQPAVQRDIEPEKSASAPPALSEPGEAHAETIQRAPSTSVDDDEEMTPSAETSSDFEPPIADVQPQTDEMADEELPLRESSPVLRQVQRKSEATDEPTTPTMETASETDEPTESELPAPPPPVQRQAVEPGSSSASSSEGVSAAKKQVDVSAESSESEETVQRQTTGEFPLRETSPVLKQVQRKAEATDQPAPSTTETHHPTADELSATPPPVQRQTDVTETSSAPSPEDIPTIEENQAEVSGERMAPDVSVKADESEETVQRQVEPEMPLRESSPVLKSAQRKAETTDEPVRSTGEPLAETHQPTADEPPGSPPTPQSQGRVSVERSNPEATVQRQTDSELPLRESSPVLKQVQRKAEAMDEPALAIDETDEPTGDDVAAPPPPGQRQANVASSSVPSSEVVSAAEKRADVSAERSEPGVTVQRQTDSELPVRESAPVLKRVQRSAESRSETVEQPSLAESASVQRRADETVTSSAQRGDLNQELVSKAEAGSRLPLNKLSSRPPVAQTKPLARTGVLPQAKGEQEIGSESLNRANVGSDPPLRPDRLSPPTIQRSSLPLAKPQRIEIVDSSTPPTQMVPPLSVPPVQRQGAEPVASTPAPEVTTGSDADVIQREPDEAPPTAAPPGESSAQSSKMDLEKLARQVYPEIKRMLARERDRSIR